MTKPSFHSVDSDTKTLELIRSDIGNLKFLINIGSWPISDRSCPISDDSYRVNDDF